MPLDFPTREADPAGRAPGGTGTSEGQFGGSFPVSDSETCPWGVDTSNSVLPLPVPVQAASTSMAANKAAASCTNPGWVVGRRPTVGGGRFTSVVRGESRWAALAVGGDRVGFGHFSSLGRIDGYPEQECASGQEEGGPVDP